MNTGETLKFAQISDPHLSDLAGVHPARLLSKRALGYLSWRKRRRHEHSTEVLAALRHDLGTQALDQLLICGDLTHISLPGEFHQARQWLDTLSPRAIGLVPGNHDSYVREPWVATYAQWAPYLASETCAKPSSLADAFPSLHVRGNVAFIGLCSALPTPPLFASGRLGREQLAKLKVLLEKTGAQGLFRVLYLHHPPLPGMEKWRKALRDAPALAEVLGNTGAELILHGHRHRWQRVEHNIGGKIIPVIGVASASARGDHGEAACYNLFSVSKEADGWRLLVENRSYNSATRCFQAGKSHSLNV